MKLDHRLSVLLATAAVVSACGGGDGNATNADATASNKWVANNGAYAGCDNNHKKRTVTLRAFGSNQATLTIREDIYDGPDCSGTLKGSFSYSSPITITLESTGISAVSGVGAGTQNLSIDRMQFSAPAMTSSLTGLGVQGLCVYYINGYSCYNTMSYSATMGSAGLYFSGNTMASLSVNGAIYVADTPLLTKQ